MEGIYPISEWFKSEPDKLITFIYWEKGQIPADRKEAMRELFNKLNNLHPCPSEHKDKWLEAIK